MILQYIYKPVFNFIYEHITGKIPEKMRNLMVTVFFAASYYAIFLEFYHGAIGFSVIDENSKDMLLLVAVALAVVFSINCRLEVIHWREWNLWIYIPFVLTAVLIFLAGLDHYVGRSYSTLVVFMLIDCVAMFYVLKNTEGYMKFFDAMARAYCLFGILIIILCILKGPHLTLQNMPMLYSILDINTNGFAKMTCTLTATALYMMIRKRKSWTGYLYAVLVGSSVLLSYLSGARFACIIWFIMLVTLFCYWISYYMKSEDKKKILTTSLVLIVVCVVSGAAMFATVHYLTPNIAKSKAKAIMEEDRDYDPVAIRKAAKEKRAANEVKHGTMAYAQKLGEDAIGDNKTLMWLNELGTGRVLIWAGYISHMNIKGHDYYLNRVGAHNNYIQFSFRAGLFTGIIWLVCTIMVALCCLTRGLIRKESTMFYPLLIFSVFFVLSMLESGYIPMERQYIFAYYLSLAPLMFIKRRKNG